MDCGIASNLQTYLRRNKLYGISNGGAANWFMKKCRQSDANFEYPCLIEDVIKTGTSTELGLRSNPNVKKILALLMPILSISEVTQRSNKEAVICHSIYGSKERIAKFDPLMYLLNNHLSVQVLFGYRSEDFQTLSYMIPCNSMSTILKETPKGMIVRKDLAQKYYGNQIINKLLTLKKYEN